MTRLPSQCQPEAGTVLPVIDRNRCDGKQDCVAVCPFDVFAMQRITVLDLAMAPRAAAESPQVNGEMAGLHRPRRGMSRLQSMRDCLS